MDLIKIGRFIAEKRREMGMTQRQLAEKLGMSDKSVSKWERGICLPDVYVYLELCRILGISLNEFLAGEDLDRERLELQAEDNLLQVATESKKRQKSLKRVITVLLILALLAFTSLVILLSRQGRVGNTVTPLEPGSPEMQVAELLSGADGAFLYRYALGEDYTGLSLYLTEYRAGEQVGRQEISAPFFSTGAAAEGMIVIIPDFARFTLRVILAAEGVRFSTELPILADAKGREYYGRGATQLSAEAKIRFGAEQGLLALAYDPEGLHLPGIPELEAGNIPPENDFLYYFSFRFSK